MSGEPKGRREVAASFSSSQRILQSDAVRHVRDLAVHALIVIKARETARVLIEASALNDSADEVRRFAQAVLDSIGQPQR